MAVTAHNGAVHSNPARLVSQHDTQDKPKQMLRGLVFPVASNLNLYERVLSGRVKLERGKSLEVPKQTSKPFLTSKTIEEPLTEHEGVTKVETLGDIDDGSQSPKTVLETDTNRPATLISNHQPSTTFTKELSSEHAPVKSLYQLPSFKKRRLSTDSQEKMDMDCMLLNPPIQSSSRINPAKKPRLNDPIDVGSKGIPINNSSALVDLNASLAPNLPKIYEAANLQARDKVSPTSLETKIRSILPDKSSRAKHQEVYQNNISLSLNRISGVGETVEVKTSIVNPVNQTPTHPPVGKVDLEKISIHILKTSLQNGLPVEGRGTEKNTNKDAARITQTKSCSSEVRTRVDPFSVKHIVFRSSLKAGATDENIFSELYASGFTKTPPVPANPRRLPELLKIPPKKRTKQDQFEINYSLFTRNLNYAASVQSAAIWPSLNHNINAGRIISRFRTWLLQRNAFSKAECKNPQATPSSLTVHDYSLHSTFTPSSSKSYELSQLATSKSSLKPQVVTLNTQQTMSSNAQDSVPCNGDLNKMNPKITVTNNYSSTSVFHNHENKALKNSSYKFGPYKIKPAHPRTRLKPSASMLDRFEELKDWGFTSRPPPVGGMMPLRELLAIPTSERTKDQQRALMHGVFHRNLRMAIATQFKKTERLCIKQRNENIGKVLSVFLSTLPLSTHELLTHEATNQ